MVVRHWGDGGQRAVEAGAAGLEGGKRRVARRW